MSDLPDKSGAPFPADAIRRHFQIPRRTLLPGCLPVPMHADTFTPPDAPPPSETGGKPVAAAIRIADTLDFRMLSS